jgi:hypothetical protein
MPRHNKRKGGAAGVTLGRGTVADHHWTEPTPTSLRQEKAQKEAQRPANRPRPALARRPLTPEELANAATISSDRLVRPAPKRNHPRAKEHVIAVAQDQAGEPCSCGLTAGAACALHGALDGHRRHVRPG